MCGGTLSYYKVGVGFQKMVGAGGGCASSCAKRGRVDEHN